MAKQSRSGWQEADEPVHRWWRFVLAFSPALVNRYLSEFGCNDGGKVVLDPFCGTGTTLIEAKRRQCHAIGLDSMDFCVLASTVKTTWEVPSEVLEKAAESLLARIAEDYSRYGFFESGSASVPCPLELPESQRKLLGKRYISPRPLQKLLVIQRHVLGLPSGPVADFFRLALGSVAVAASNVGFGPEIYHKQNRPDVDVWGLFTDQVNMMLTDLREVQRLPFGTSEVHNQDARDLQTLRKIRVDAVITSPPYPNEKNYSRITRIEHLITNYVRNRTDLTALKKRLLRSNSQNIYKNDQDDQFVRKFSSVQKLADEIEQRRIALGKTSGFERRYAAVTRHYFGGMYRHFLGLKSLMRSGSRAAYVVGDQMSFLRVKIKTGEILAELADDVGFKVLRIDPWRERWASASREYLKEEVVVLVAR